MASPETVEIRQFPCLSDNFGVLIHDPGSSTTIAIDVPDAAAYLAVLDKEGWSLTDILITHHHWDHTQGLDELKQVTGATVTGPERSRTKIPGMAKTVEDGDKILCGPIEITALATPGHTLDQISWYMPSLQIAHTGDTLFSLGCGRVFEGDMEMMWASLDKLKRALPPETRIYCGHEYTQSNGRFAMSIEPDNVHLRARIEEVDLMRAEGRPTLPTTMGQELATNPFLRANEPSVKATLGMEDKTDAEVFGELRARKDKA